MNALENHHLMILKQAARVQAPRRLFKRGKTSFEPH